ncbi:MAG: hypothetical protein ACR2OZ_04240 [Verrucomicrobiales bacterium]
MPAAIQKIIRDVTNTTRGFYDRIRELNWELARALARYREDNGSHETAALITSLSNGHQGLSESKLTKLLMIGEFSQADLERIGLPQIDPFVFCQHKPAILQKGTKKLLRTPEAKEFLERLGEGASDFELRKARRKGTRY